MTPTAPPGPVIVALDDMTEARALGLARGLAGKVWGFKVNDLLLRCGVDIIPRLGAYGRVFCDVKLHDIPNTVANQVRVLEEAGADLITLHGTGGEAMLRAAREASRGAARLLAVTVLTSLSDQAARAVYGRGTAEMVPTVAALALECGMDGIICSPADLELLEGVDAEHRLLRVTPGVRPAWHERGDDQARVLTPAEALNRGADLLVIGRPITAAADPLEASERILAELPSR